jgi:hypothetical protein
VEARLLRCVDRAIITDWGTPSPAHSESSCRMRCGSRIGLNVADEISTAGPYI